MSVKIINKITLIIIFIFICLLSFKLNCYASEYDNLIQELNTSTGEQNISNMIFDIKEELKIVNSSQDALNKIINIANTYNVKLTENQQAILLSTYFDFSSINTTSNTMENISVAQKNLFQNVYDFIKTIPNKLNSISEKSETQITETQQNSYVKTVNESINNTTKLCSNIVSKIISFFK